MNLDLEALLCNAYPSIFLGQRSSSSPAQMCWGIECGDGWFYILDVLCQRLQFFTEQHGAPQVIVSQIKEKWGGLRFYSKVALSPEQRAVVGMAQAMSFRVCDQCGRPGETLVSGFLHVTRCSEHAPQDAMTKDEFLIIGTKQVFD